MSSDNDFEAVMRQMGVRRLDERGKAPVKKVDSGRPAVARGKAQAATTPQPSQKPGVREREIKASDEWDALKKENRRLQKENLKLRQRSNELQSELNGLKTIEVEGIETVQGVLQDWRVSGGRELQTWLAGLAGLGRAEEFLSYLKVGHPGLLRKLVDETAVLHCRREDCVLPSGMIPLEVEAKTCEICGGLELESWGDRLSDLLLLSGVRKVVFRGHRVALLRYLAQQMDARIEVQVVGLSVNYASPDSSTWTALWRRSGEDTEGIQADCRVKADSLGQWVTRVAYRLEKE